MKLHPKCEGCDACQKNCDGMMYCAAGYEWDCLGWGDVYVDED